MPHLRLVVPVEVRHELVGLFEREGNRVEPFLHDSSLDGKILLVNWT